MLNRRYEITYKPDGSPVTTADVLLENIIKNYLVSQIANLNFIGRASQYSLNDRALLSENLHFLLF
ncbi:hypothetical protein [Dolichospermum sp. UHCC 0299]|uniref:hypothetical protein n=1 Tax=Dolichospermum sp. UHCC 0299 TaxID=2590014 RepID=UPI00144627A9|nr:hypothetical protein [Dolichospermum sp. UHCC 0299]